MEAAEDRGDGPGAGTGGTGADVWGETDIPFGVQAPVVIVVLLAVF